MERGVRACEPQPPPSFGVGSAGVWRGGELAAEELANDGGGGCSVAKVAAVAGEDVGAVVVKVPRDRGAGVGVPPVGGLTLGGDDDATALPLGGAEAAPPGGEGESLAKRWEGARASPRASPLASLGAR